MLKTNGTKTIKGENEMKKPIEIINTYRLVSIDTSNLEETETVNWISRTQRGVVHTVRGVPSSDLDVLIVPQIEGLLQVVDLCKKTGKYNGEIRNRITVRNVPANQAPTKCVALWFDLDGATAIIHLGEQVFRFGRYRSLLDSNSDLKHIVRWHYNRYYQILSEHDVLVVEAEFCQTITSGEYTLAEANRLASRLLYSQARQNGYRKLTKREQLRLGLSGQWHTEAEYASAQNKFAGKYSPTGCSEYTLEISISKQL